MDTRKVVTAALLFVTIFSGVAYCAEFGQKVNPYSAIIDSIPSPALSGNNLTKSQSDFYSKLSMARLRAATDKSSADTNEEMELIGESSLGRQLKKLNPSQKVKDARSKQYNSEREVADLLRLASVDEQLLSVAIEQDSSVQELLYVQAIQNARIIKLLEQMTAKKK